MNTFSSLHDVAILISFQEGYTGFLTPPPRSVLAVFQYTTGIDLFGHEMAEHE